MTITQEELKKLLHYDPETGAFTWLRITSNRVKVGMEVGSILNSSCGKSYIETRICCKRYLIHRLAFLYMTGSLPSEEVDHIDGNGCNNKWINLRKSDRSENQKNIRRRIDNKSGITGVYWSKNRCKWIAQISLNGRIKFLGNFDNIFDAACVRKSAHIKHGYHVNHGSDRPL